MTRVTKVTINRKLFNWISKNVPADIAYKNEFVIVVDDGVDQILIDCDEGYKSMSEWQRDEFGLDA